MKHIALAALMLTVSATVLSAPPPELGAALVKWAAPASVSRYQFSLVDLNADGTPDAVVRVTDPESCGNTGCPLVVFKGTSAGYEIVANSGPTRSPVYVLDENRFGWRTLAAVVGKDEGLVPIRYNGKAYTSTPYLRARIELDSRSGARPLNFEDWPAVGVARTASSPDDSPGRGR